MMGKTSGVAAEIIELRAQSFNYTFSLPICKFEPQTYSRAVSNFDRYPRYGTQNFHLK